MLIPMPHWARAVVGAALFTLVPCLTSAQTLIVRGVPAGGTAELVVNTEAMGKAEADPNGDAIISWKLAGPEMEARIYLDVCPGVHRVLLLDRNLLPRPQDEGCERRDVVGVFWLKPQSTLVVNVERQIPRVLLRQRQVTIAELDAPVTRRTVPTGLVIFGGTGGQTFSDIFNIACGNAQPCDGGDSGFGFTAGVELWPTKWLSLEGAAMRTPWPSFEGGEGEFTFTSDFEPRLVVTLSGKLGVPLGPVRLYGKGGGIYHRAKLTTEQTLSGNTMTTAFETEGWSWLAGGGIEGWVRPSVGLYLEVTSASFKGEDPGGGEAFLDERLNSLFVGLRFRILGGR